MALWLYQWRNEPKHFFFFFFFFFGGGGAIFAREQSDQARGSVATRAGVGCVLGSFFIFRLENVQSGAYLRRKFRLDDIYYMGKLVWN